MTQPSEAHLWRTAQQVCTTRQLRCAELVWKRGFTSRQAALLLGITHGTVQDHLRNARLRIQTHLDRKAA